MTFVVKQYFYSIKSIKLFYNNNSSRKMTVVIIFMEFYCIIMHVPLTELFGIRLALFSRVNNVTSDFSELLIVKE